MSSLLAQQSAISVTANNVSNVNTPGQSTAADLNEGDAERHAHGGHWCYHG